ncbi:HepT-like ribonuclease domain-containing protein [Rathayibacter sp. CAU 1779]
MSTPDIEQVERRLADLAGFTGDAAYTVSLGLAAYLDETPGGRVLRNNGRQIVIQIATVAEKLPQSFKDEHPDVDWIGIARMRNLIAHHYDNVNDRLVFTALAERIPSLAASLGVG